MSPIKSIKDMIRTEGLEQARLFFVQLLEDASLSDSEAIKGLGDLCACMDDPVFLEKKVHLLNVFAKYSESRTNYTNAIECYLKILNISEKNSARGLVLESLSSNYLKDGQLAPAIESLKRALDYYLLRRNHPRGLKIIQYCRDERLNFSGLVDFEVLFLLCRGSYKEAVELIEACQNKILSDEWKTGIQYYQILSNALKNSTSHYFRRIKILNRLDELNILLDSRKRDQKQLDLLFVESLSLIIENILLNHDKSDCYRDVIRFYFLWTVGARSITAKAVEAVIKDIDKIFNADMSCKMKGAFKDEYVASSYISKIPLFLRRRLSPVASSSSGEAMLSSEEVLALERDIKFLSRFKNNSLLDEKRKRLAELDPGHPLLSFFQGSLTDEALKELEGEYSKENEDDGGYQINLNSRVLKKIVREMEVELFLKSFKDLAVAFSMMDLDEVCLEVINRFEELEGPIENEVFLNISYIKIEALTKLERFAQAIEEISLIIKVYPLNRNELVCFLYLQAEVYRKMGRVGDARKYYKEILNGFGDYRLAQERIKWLDQNK